MIYGSVCSGIEAASVAWHPLGWRAAFLSEIEPFPRAVLTHHYPTVPLHGDFTTIEAGDYEPIDLLVGGTPCQDFSIAGLRAGMAGDRGNLTLQFLTLARRLRPRWVVWENVPGVLSSNGGRDFGAFLGGLGELGYGWAYRTLDAQHFGVPQRRRRIFVVGYLGDWRYPASVLFERHSLSGDTAPRREARKDVAPTISARTKGGGGLGTDFDLDGGLVAFGGNNTSGPVEISGAVLAHGGRQDFATETFVYSIMPQNSGKDYKARQVEVAQPIMAGGPVGGNQGGDYIVQPVAFDTTQITSAANRSSPKAGDPCHPLAAGAHAPAIAIQEIGKRTGKSTTDVRAGMGISNPGDPMFTLQSGAQHGVGHGSAVRRLLPVECCRLQGFPDDYLDILYRGKPAADGPKYRALGNSMAVPVMAWIGSRIQLVDEILASRRDAA